MYCKDWRLMLSRYMVLFWWWSQSLQEWTTLLKNYHWSHWGVVLSQLLKTLKTIPYWNLRENIATNGFQVLSRELNEYIFGSSEEVKFFAPVRVPSLFLWLVYLPPVSKFYIRRIEGSGASLAAVYGVAQSWTWLMWLSTKEHPER